MKLLIQEKELLSFYSSTDEITIFDIGAHNGDSTLRYKSIFPNSICYCFEPVPSNFEDLKNNIIAKTNIFPFQIALSNTNGETTFHLSTAENKEMGSKSSSLLAPSEEIKKVTPWLRFDDTIHVTTKVLDDFCDEQDIHQIDFVHMDVQGAELLVLQGATKMLQHINTIWLEVENVELYKGQPLKNDVSKFLSSNGFQLAIDDVNWIAGDQLWIRNEFLNSKKTKRYILKKQFRNTIVGNYYNFRKIASKIKNYIMS